MGIFSRIFKKDEPAAEGPTPSPAQPPGQRVPEHALPSVVVELPGVTVEEADRPVDLEVAAPVAPRSNAPQFAGFGNYVSTRMAAAAPVMTPGPPPALATPPPWSPPTAPPTPPPAHPSSPPQSPPPPPARRESSAMRSSPPLPPPSGPRLESTLRMGAAPGVGSQRPPPPLPPPLPPPVPPPSPSTRPGRSTLPIPRTVRHTPTDPIPATRSELPAHTTSPGLSPPPGLSPLAGTSPPPPGVPKPPPSAPPASSDDSTQPQKLTKVPAGGAISLEPLAPPKMVEPDTPAKVLADAKPRMTPVRDFMIDLEAGEASRDWIALTEDRLEELRNRLAPFVETQPLRDDIDAMLGALAALPKQGRTLERSACTRVREAFGMLAGRSPDVFATDAERRARERVIVESTLELGKAASPIAIERLLKGGFDTLRAFFDSTPERIAELGAVQRSVAEQLIASLERHRKDAAAVQVDSTRSIDKMRIAGMVADLREHTADYERVSAKWSKEASAEKKTIAQARRETLLRIKVGLARLGELALLDAIERMPFERKVEYLEKYVADEGW